MNHRILSSNNKSEIVELFTSVFTDSEGQAEGEIIGNLSSELANAIDGENIICFATFEQNLIIASIFFSRLYFKQAINVYILAPVAVSSKYQGKGIGQSLINYGLSELKNRSVDVAITYGDPSFYLKVGFSSLSEEIIQAPLKLSMPEGWLGQSLKENPILQINEKPTCVKEFDNASYW